MKLDKNDTVRKSDWRIQDLSAIQQCYAATDAYVSITYLVIQSFIKLMIMMAARHE
jgi:ribonuclease D